MVCFPAVVFSFSSIDIANQSWSFLIWFSCRQDQHLPICLWIACYFQISNCARSSRRRAHARLALLPLPPDRRRPQAWHSLHRQEQENGKVSSKDTSSSSCKTRHDSLLTRTWSHGHMAHALAVLSWTLNTHDDTHNPCAQARAAAQPAIFIATAGRFTSKGICRVYPWHIPKWLGKDMSGISLTYTRHMTKWLGKDMSGISLTYSRHTTKWLGRDIPDIFRDIPGIWHSVSYTRYISKYVWDITQLVISQVYTTDI
jgi:hypothetical protein